MSIIVIDGLDIRTNSDTIKNYCQNFGRVINCYTKSNQCFITFAEKNHAEEFIHASPHRIDCNGPVHATWKATLERTTSFQTRSSLTNGNDPCRLTIRGTSEQLEEKNLIRYFSRYGQIRMCLSSPNQDFASIVFDDRTSAERALKESRHFLNGRSLIVQLSTSDESFESNKRMKLSDSNQTTISTLTSQFQSEKEQFLLEKKHLQTQLQQHLQLQAFEKQQWNEYFNKQQMDYLQQINQYQILLNQTREEILHKDKQIEQLKQENKDIEYRSNSILFLRIR